MQRAHTKIFGVAVVFRVLYFKAQAINHALRRGQVGVAHGEADYVNAGSSALGYFLFRVCKMIGGQVVYQIGQLHYVAPYRDSQGCASFLVSLAAARRNYTPWGARVNFSITISGFQPNSEEGACRLQEYGVVDLSKEQGRRSGSQAKALHAQVDLAIRHAALGESLFQERRLRMPLQEGAYRG